MLACSYPLGVFILNNDWYVNQLYSPNPSQPSSFSSQGLDMEVDPLGQVGWWRDFMHVVCVSALANQTRKIIHISIPI